MKIPDSPHHAHHLNSANISPESENKSTTDPDLARHLSNLSSFIKKQQTTINKKKKRQKKWYSVLEDMHDDLQDNEHITH